MDLKVKIISRIDENIKAISAEIGKLPKPSSVTLEMIIAFQTLIKAELWDTAHSYLCSDLQHAKGMRSLPTIKYYVQQILLLLEILK